MSIVKIDSINLKKMSFFDIYDFEDFFLENALIENEIISDQCIEKLFIEDSIIEHCELSGNNFVKAEFTNCIFKN